MERHASILCPREGLAIINIGFGLGLIDTFIQKSKPCMHYIVEAHPDVYKHMIETGWDKKPGTPQQLALTHKTNRTNTNCVGVTILFGRWQDMIPQHVEGQILFDGIYFDTFGEFYEDLRYSLLNKVLIQDNNNSQSYRKGISRDSSQHFEYRGDLFVL